MPTRSCRKPSVFRTPGNGANADESRPALFWSKETARTTLCRTMNLRTVSGLRRNWLIGGALVSAVLVGFVLVAVGRDRGTAQSTQARGSGGFVGGDFHSLVADPVVAKRIFVGGHQAVSVSSNGGATWSEVPSLAGADAMGWAFDDTTMWVGGHPGLAKATLTNDAAQRPTALAVTDIHALGGDGRVLYAAGPAVGFIRSIDDAATWSTMSATSGQSFFGRILVDPSDVDHVVVADAQSGVLASRDGGATWDRLTLTPSSWVSSPDGLATLYASGGKEAEVSTDGGATWSSLQLPESATVVEADPATPNHLYAGAHLGDEVRVWSSDDNGRTWQAP